MGLSEAKNVAMTAGGMIAKPIVETFITPHPEEIKKGKALKKELYSDAFNNHFTHYLETSFENNSYISTIYNSRLLLRDVYVPLSLEKQVSDKKEPIQTITNYDVDFFEKNNKLIIIDLAGMGKSTLLSFLFLSIINENKGYPVIVNLRRLSESNPVLNEIKKELNLIDRELNEDVLRYLISHGVFIFLFDGFDEIVDDEKEAVVLNLSEFIKKSSANRFIITSRPDKDINSFAFSRYKINPLSFSQAKKLFDNYDQFDKKEISKNLIVELENNDNRPPRKLTSFLVYDSTK